MAKGIANQIVNSVPDMVLAAIANRTLGHAVECFGTAGIRAPRAVATRAALEKCIYTGTPTVIDDHFLLCVATGLDCLVDATGAVEYGAQVTIEAIRHGRHMVSMNAELDGTVGPNLKCHADAVGVILIGSDGVQLNLWRFVRSIGLTPLVCGNIKGLQDPYRTPATQAGFAAKWGQDPRMVTSFADGTKISFEQAIVANATGMTVGRNQARKVHWDGPREYCRYLARMEQQPDFAVSNGGSLRYQRIAAARRLRPDAGQRGLAGRAEDED